MSRRPRIKQFDSRMGGDRIDCRPNFIPWHHGDIGMRNDEGICNECFSGPECEHKPACSQYEDFVSMRIREYNTARQACVCPGCTNLAREGFYTCKTCSDCVNNEPPQKHPHPPAHDPVNHPKHYTNHPSGVECIEIVRHMNFNIGGAMKYLWRSDEKGFPIEDLKKAIWLIEDEIKKREKNDQTDLVKKENAREEKG